MTERLGYFGFTISHEHHLKPEEIAYSVEGSGTTDPITLPSSHVHQGYFEADDLETHALGHKHRYYPPSLRTISIKCCW